MELRLLMGALWRWLWLLVAAVVVAAVLSLWNTNRTPAMYQATTTVRVGQFLDSPNPDTQDIATTQQLAQLYAEAAKRQPVLQAAIEALGLSWEWQAVAGGTAAWAVTGTQLIQISFIHGDPQVSRAMADEIARQLILQSPSTAKDREHERRLEFANKQMASLQTKIEEAQAEVRLLWEQYDLETSAREMQSLRGEINVLEQKINDWEATYSNLLNFATGSRVNYLSVADPASVRSLASNPAVNLLIAVSIALALAVSGILLIEYLDDTVRTRSEAASAVGLPLLGAITSVGRPRTRAEALVTLTDPSSPVAEAYRSLKTNVQFAIAGKGTSILLVASPGPQEGKSTTAANLALTFAIGGKKTILVDADLRHPTIHALFGYPNETGLSSVLAAAAVAEAEERGPGSSVLLPRKRNAVDMVHEYLVQTWVPNLRLLTSGPATDNPLEALSHPSVAYLLDALAVDADLVILDSPPALAVADTAVLAARGPVVLLVLRAGRTTREAAVQAKAALLDVGARVLGVALNQAPMDRSAYYAQRYYRPRSSGRATASAPVASLVRRMLRSIFTARNSPAGPQEVKPPQAS